MRRMHTTVADEAAHDVLAGLDGHVERRRHFDAGAGVALQCQPGELELGPLERRVRGLRGERVAGVFRQRPCRCLAALEQVHAGAALCAHTPE